MDVLKAEMVESIYDYNNDEYEGNLRVPHIRIREVEYAEKRRGVILMRRWKKSERYQFKVSENEEEFGMGFL